MERKKIEQSVRTILEAIGEDLNREGLRDTPKRVARMCEEIFSGINRDPKKEFKTYKTKNEDEMIIIKDIPFYSICEHHLLPFFGRAHIVYIPKENKITGFSTLVRVIDIMARRPLLQERLTHQIADFLMKNLKPMGVLVVIEAQHLCLSMIGVKKSGTTTVTSAIRGAMRSAPTRAEAFSLIKSK